VSKRFPDIFWYLLVAALNIAAKLSVEGPVVRLLADIGKGEIGEKDAMLTQPMKEKIVNVGHAAVGHT
jgi:hypothetical protein